MNEEKIRKYPLRMAVRYFKQMKELEQEIEKADIRKLEALLLKLDIIEITLNYWVSKIPENFLEEYIRITSEIEEKYEKMR